MRIIPKLFSLAFGSALLLVAAGPLATAARAADPQPCQRLNAAFDQTQRHKVDGWLHQEFPGTDFTVAYSCRVDAKRVAVAVSDFSGLQSSVYVLDLSHDSVQPRRLLEGAIESPVVLSRPGGALDLFFVQQEPDKGLLLRAYRVVALDGGKIDTLFEAHYDSQARGCAYAGSAGVPRVLVAAAVRFTDMNKDGAPDIVLDREIQDCSSGKNQRADQVFLATPQGWRPRP